ncbi:MAG: glutathione S-transferase family protein [Pseudomonadota bacterium]
MTLVLHHLNASRSQRIVWLLEELGVPYELVRYARDPVTRLAPPELLKVHPLGKAPLLEHDGAVIAETGAIAEHLLAAFDPEHRLHPKPGTPDHARYLEWLHSAEGAPFLPGLFLFYLSAYGLEESPLTAKMREEAAKSSAHVEAHLAAHPYFAGEAFSAADCLMGFQIGNAEARFGLGDAPATADWLARVRARPAHARMLEAGV